MRNELINQYAHTWRIFERIVREFDDHAWIHTGRGPTMPARTAFHLLKGVKYYIQDSSTTSFASGKPFDSDWITVDEGELPSQDDILTCSKQLQMKTEKWLSEIDFNAENQPFPWAGETNLGVVIFLLRHSVFHLGELSSLLSESKNGETADHWVKAL